MITVNNSTPNTCNIDLNFQFNEINFIMNEKWEGLLPKSETGASSFVKHNDSWYAYIESLLASLILFI